MSFSNMLEILKEKEVVWIEGALGVNGNVIVKSVNKNHVNLLLSNKCVTSIILKYFNVTG